MTRPVRIGLLGCAHIAKAALIDVAPHVPEIEVAAVASRDLARSEAYARNHGVPRAYGDYAALLADPEIDAIYNPLPNSLHAEWTIRALQAGKAVLCEKPLASNAEQASRMVEAAAAADRPLMEAFHYRHHPLATFVAELVRSGRLGAIRAIEAELSIPGAMVPADNIRFKEDLGGGATMDLGSYCINALRLVAGEEPEVLAAVASLVSPGIDGAMQAQMRFPSGALGRITASLTAAELKIRLVVDGEGGRLEVDNPFLPQRGHCLTLEVGGQRTEQTFDLTPTYVFQARAFAKVVRGEPETWPSAEDGVANMAVIDAVYRAAGLSPRQ